MVAAYALILLGLNFAKGLNIAQDVVSADEDCPARDPWIKTLEGLRSSSRTFLARGCDSRCISLSRPGPIDYEIQGEDSGYEDVWQVVNNFKVHEKCQKAGKRIAFERALELREANSTKRQGVFAAMGCLQNRETWSKVYDANMAPNIGIFSECTIGRLYRQGVDVSLPTTPYPRLLEHKCDQSRLFSGAFGTPFYEVELKPLSVETDYDFYFSGSPTSSVRERLITKKGQILEFPRSKFNIIHSTTRHVKNMPEQKWMCKQEVGRCRCLEDASVAHHSDLQRSLFGLVPRGHGVYSFRLTEVMLAGAVPVIVSNGWVLPFSEFLDWDAFSVRLDEAHFISDPAKALGALIKEISPTCIHAMRARARHVALQHFSSIAGITQGLAAVLASRSLGCDGGGTKDTKQSLCLNGGGPARRDVSIGTAEVCLPIHLQAARLSEGTRLFETDGKSGSFRGCQEEIKKAHAKGKKNYPKKMGNSEGSGKIFGARRPEDEGRIVINTDITDCEMLDPQVSVHPKKEPRKVHATTNQSSEIPETKSAVAWLVDALSPWSKPEESTPSTAVHREAKNISILKTGT